MALPAGSYQPAEITYLDAGNEKGVMKFFGKPITAANHDAQAALWATFLSAADALALGARSRDVYDDESLYAVAQPTNGAARELKLWVQFQDNTNGKKMSTSLPTIDPTIPEYVAGARDAVVLDSPTAIVDFIDAFEAFAVNPEQPTHGITVTALKVVGRNS